jgi:hypothetical protein
VYVKDSDAKPNKLDVKWTRHVLEDFGPLNDKHTGSIHYVQCVDIDGDGVDELLVALMGSDPPSWEKTGVWAYKRKILSLSGKRVIQIASSREPGKGRVQKIQAYR